MARRCWPVMRRYTSICRRKPSSGVMASSAWTTRLASPRRPSALNLCADRFSVTRTRNPNQGGAEVETAVPVSSLSFMSNLPNSHSRATSRVGIRFAAKCTARKSWQTACAIRSPPASRAPELPMKILHLGHVVLVIGLVLSPSTSAPRAEIALGDGTVVRATVEQEHLEMQTSYGKLTIPFRDIRKIEFGQHLPPGKAEEIAGVVEQLGDADW